MCVFAFAELCKHQRLIMKFMFVVLNCSYFCKCWKELSEQSHFEISVEEEEISQQSVSLALCNVQAQC